MALKLIVVIVQVVSTAAASVCQWDIAAIYSQHVSHEMQHPFKKTSPPGGTCQSFFKFKSPFATLERVINEKT